ncbi:hypothetical protein F383_34410 [Gossypium arboreum]|uniref:Uncharacterized protein n=1 Tax=Gossypium arboreum TaxID=29729 RepID=A0A0B0N469_GOSAR|nr:hypothetical protein F383_34410 [Gossypium arboreum]
MRYPRKYRQVPTFEKPRMSHRNRSDMCFCVRTRLGRWYRLMIYV